MFKKFFLINFILLFIAPLAFGETFDDVKVYGNKRISKESILVFVSSLFAVKLVL